MLSVVTWLWGTRYEPKHVLRLREGLRRHLHVDHRFYCISDRELPGDIVTIPLPNPKGLARARRLQIFDRSLEKLLASGRILQLDIDAIVVGDVTPLVDRSDPFVIWKTPPSSRWKNGDLMDNPEGDEGGPYNTSMVLRNAGVFPTIWADYLSRRKELEAVAKSQGLWTLIASIYPERNLDGSKKKKVRPIEAGDDDQAIVSLYARALRPAIWLERDGIYKWGRRGFSDKERLPENARIVFFNGSLENSRNAVEDQVAYPWITEHWR